MRWFVIFSFFFAGLTSAADTRFLTDHFSGSGICADCHNGLIDQAGNDVSIEKDWAVSMMAFAAKDPFWQAKVASELNRNPHLAAVINDTCSACHAPMANYEAKVSDAEFKILGNSGLLNPSNPFHDAAMDGISCTVCHQIKDDETLGTPKGFSGQYNIADNLLAYGQYTATFSNPMIKNSGYTPTYSAHISESKLCATCHNLKTPFVDAQGNVVSTGYETEFPEQMVYTEWENSEFAESGTEQSCQSCHMHKASGKVVISNRPKNATLIEREGFSRHDFSGANSVMLNLLANNSQELEVDSTDIAAGIARSREMLKVSGSIGIVDSKLSHNELIVNLVIYNQSGHKLPTSYPSRRVFIHFTVMDNNGNTIFESGKINDDGSIVGVDSDYDLTAFEPHYEEINSAEQVQVYEPVMGDTDGNVTYTLLRSSTYLKDNRIPPAGFDKYSVADDIRVAGDAYQDEDFNLGEDRITYRIPVDSTGTLKIKAELIYQPLAYGFVADLYQDSSDPIIASFQSMYEKETLKSELIASVTLDIDPQIPVNEDAIDFIERLYINLLGRTSDTKGLAYWSNKLLTHSAAYVAFGFFNSDEFKNLNLNDEGFVDLLYTTLFDREADRAGEINWLSQLRSGTLRDMVLYGFFLSQEFKDLAESFSVAAFNESDKALYQIKQFVVRFYQLVLLRNPDENGYNYWTRQLYSGALSARAFAKGFFFSNEFISQNHEDNTFIDIAYQTILNRPADQDGKNYWLGKLAGGLTRLEMINAFIGSFEFKLLAESYGMRVQ